VSFRARIGLAAAVAVAIAVTVFAGAAYVLTRDVLYGQVDDALRERAGEAALRDTGAGFVIRLPAPPLGISGTSAQIVAAAEDAAPPSLAGVPITAGDRAVAAGRRTPGFREVDVDGMKVRAYVRRIAPGFAVLVARPLTEVDDTLSRLRWILIVVALVGVAGAALLGLLVARSALRPVRRLTETAEDVARTADLSRRIDVTGDDELNRLAATVNTMLASLER
jgi:two-component system sensor histidine kinase MprB